MKEIILKLIEEKPKHYTKMIANNSVLLDWVNDNSLSSSEQLTSRIFSAINQESDVCKYGNIKKFINISKGFTGCGRANVCQCTREQVSQSTSISKSKISSDDKIKSNLSRAKTNLKKYGVENIGQTSIAKLAHKKTYLDNEKVTNIVNKIAKTKLERYNNENYNNVEQIKATFKEKYPTAYWVEKYDNENLYILNDKDKLELLFSTMNAYEISEHLKVHVQTVFKYLNLHKLREPFKSEPEREIVKFLEDNGVTNIIRNTRKLLPSRKEIDIYLPDFKVAIEYNGVFWHHEDIAHIDKEYHYNKFKECADLDIQLITIFSNFWSLKKPIVKRTLLNKIGIHNSKIHARKCIIKNVPASETNLFLSNNHVQGYAPSSINYGLYYNNELVSIMTFGKRSRPGIGKKEIGIELIRYASSSRVIGGASKLLSHYMKNTKTSQIVSYSDNEWSDGNLYKVLGFNLTAEIAPSYWYITPKSEQLYHRFNFAKFKLKEKGIDVEEKPVKQILKDMGILTVWDCGKKRWVLDII